MSYVLDQPTTSQRRRRWPWILAAVLVVALVATAAFVLGRSSDPAAQPTPSAPAPAPSVQPSPQDSTLGTLRWTTVGGTPVPISAQHGPHIITDKKVARGYTHDKAGAVLAALNISTRMASTAPPSTYRATVRQRTYGDQQAMLRTLEQQYSSASAAQTRVQQYWYAITAGNPQGSLVQVSVLVATPQASSMGGYARVSRTLAWRDGDWKMQVPVSSPTLTTTTTGHTPIPMPEL